MLRLGLYAQSEPSVTVVVVVGRPRGAYFLTQEIAMRIAQTRLTLDTEPREIKEITAEVARWVEDQKIGAGLLTAYIPHTSASLLIQENASPEVRHDLGTFLRRLVPEDSALYRHNDEGPDDMPAHIKSMLTQTQLTVPVADGRLQLGVWQGIFLLEHRATPHRRSLILTLIGETMTVEQ
jgi:secondary thiamine-phosphate synthase enzyme